MTEGTLSVRTILPRLAAALALTTALAAPARAQTTPAAATAAPSANAMVNLVRALVAKGTLSAAEGDALLQQANAEAAQARAATPPPGTRPPPGSGRVGSARALRWFRSTSRAARADVKPSALDSAARSRRWRAMPKTPDELFATLRSLGIETTTAAHAPAFTVEEARAHRGPIGGAHAKNLFVKDKKGRLFLIVALEDDVVDLKRAHERVGAQGRLSFGSAERLMEVWGVDAGFGHAVSGPSTTPTAA